MFSELNEAFKAKPGLMLEILKCLAEISVDETVVADQETIVRFKNFLILNSGDVMVFLQNSSDEFSVSVLETFLE